MKTTKWFEDRQTWVEWHRGGRCTIPCVFIDRAFVPPVVVEPERAIATLYLPERRRSATVDGHDEPPRAARAVPLGWTTR